MDAPGIALLSAGITSVAGVVGAFVTMYLAPGKRSVDEETRKKIIVETAEIADRVNEKRITALHSQLEELSTLANTRYKRQLHLESYVDKDVEWHREVIEILRNAGIEVPPAPKIPTPNGDT